ncbi:glycoside hydrolase family 2 protein [Paenibacillus yanchengensis]|uniref:Beta-mannosidase B n=1 Tax=Paenibacillus yanchengensis TaxID=2035833 RepID=A0ABW4YGT9_9BACL
MQLLLDGKWKVTHVAYNESIAPLLEPSFVPEGWLDAQIPEEIHATLRNNGIIRGHVYSKDTDEERWIEEADWVYYKELFVPKSMQAKQVNITFKGLDTFCDIYLNGEKIGFGENMHAALTIDVTNSLRYGERNVFVVRFYSPIKYVEHLDQTDIFSITTSDRILARKAQMNYGWDFCGRCVTTGIWKSVEINAFNEAQIDHYYLYTKRVEGDKAYLALEIDTFANDEDLTAYQYRVSLDKDGENVLLSEGSLDHHLSLDLTVDQPLLWWPRPYGNPELYDFTLTIEKNGKIVQQKTQRFGIRTVQIIQENQVDGRSFIFAVNGRKLFIRGANWVPTKMIYTDITDEDYEVLMDYAEDGNISMLRIWGGGIYEHHKMFELCDEKGIMIWNDFMFACGIYPQNEEFLANAANEAELIIKEYRNYTSLVVWAGDNENGQAYGWAGRPYEFMNDKVSNVVLQEACRRLDPNRFYMPTSPYSPDEFFKGGDNPSSPYQGDAHIYIMSADPGVQEYRDYGKNYYKRIKGFKPRFMSEFGFISFPEKDTFYKFNFLNEPIRARGEMTEFLPFTNEYIDNLDHDKLIYYSQVYNSMAFKYWIEYFRSLKWTCAGSLYWKFNDPVADVNKDNIFPTHMATVDMYQLPKMTFYYTRRAYDDVIVTCEETPDGYDVYIISELMEDIKGLVTVEHRDFSGQVTVIKQLDALSVKDSSTLICHVNTSDIPIKNAAREYLRVAFITDNGTLDNRYYFKDIHEINQLQLEDAGLRIMNTKRQDNSITVTLRADKFARHVRLNILDKRAKYSDNYFEMDAGTEKTITISLYDPSDLESTVLYIEGENVPRIVQPLASI